MRILLRSSLALLTLVALVSPAASAQSYLPFKGRCALSSDGQIVTFGEVTNNQPVAVEARGDLIVTDSAGRQVLYRRGALSSVSLNPGERALMMTFDRPSAPISGKGLSCTLKAAAENALPSAYLLRGAVSNLKLTKTTPPLKATATVKNTSSGPAAVKLYVTGYDAAGQVVAGFYTVRNQPLLPGESATFDLMGLNPMALPTTLKAMAVLIPK